MMETMAVQVTAEATGSSPADPPRKFAEPESPRAKPPPLDGSSSEKVAAGVPKVVTPKASDEYPRGAYGSHDPPTSRKGRYPKENPFYPTFKSASSFSFPSPSNPPPSQLSYSVSSPALPYLPEGAIESLQTGKYRPRTRSPSDGADVRWYFCKTPLGPNEKAASVPLLEVVGKGEYFRFSVSDSSTLEAAFLEREEELVSAWWKEYAESRVGPSSSVPSSNSAASRKVGVNAQVEKPGKAAYSDPNRYRSSRNFEDTHDDDESVGVIVKGGLYEVDLRQRRCSPVYWRGDHRRVLRGHWFALKGGLDWLPLREDIAEQLEIAYESKIWRRRSFQPSGLFAARVNLHGATEGLHALFTGEDDSWEAWLCVDASGISFVLGLRSSDVRLRRGFLLPESAQPTQDEIRQRKEEEMDDYASKVPVRHVVFMVHGIGQRLEKANLVDDVGTFRHTVAMLAEQHLTQYQRDAQRVLFIPCQWRRGLKLGGEQAVEDCTLEGVRALRTMLSATVHDVLYYMSPVYCQDIIDSVSHSLNRLYGKFIKRNPNYDGKVSIYGHSLGSVLSYDILCHQKELISAFPILEVRSEVEEKLDASPESRDEITSKSGESLSGETSGTEEDRTEVEEESGDRADISSPGNVVTRGAVSLSGENSGPKESTINIEEKSGDGLEGFPASGSVLYDHVDQSSGEEMTGLEDDNEKVRYNEKNVPSVDTAELENSEISLEETIYGLEDVPKLTEEIDRSHLETEQEDLQVSSEHIANGPSENLSEDQTLEVNAAFRDTLEESASGPSDESVAEKTETEALREEVRMLREKLAALTSEQTRVKDLRSFPIVHADSDGETTCVESSERIDVEGGDVTGDTGSSGGDGPGAPGTNDSGDDKRNSRGSSEANDPSSKAEPNRLENKPYSRKHFTPYISYTKLDFKVDTFYAVGSPLGVFLSLRNIRLGIGEGQDYWNDDGIEEEMPDVRQMMNIFQPYDPVAYRIEPLVCREFVDRRPTFIPYHKGGKRLHIGMQEFGEEMSARSRAIVDSLSSVGTRVASAFISGAAEKDGEGNPETEKEEKSYGALMMERLTGGPEGRMDYMLQDATFEHQYISVISSHTSYWHDLDTALFILRHLYKDIPEQPPPTNVPEETNGVPGLRPVSEEHNGPAHSKTTEVGKLQDDSDPDDLPLTFSGREGIAAILDAAKSSNPGFTV